MHVHLRVAAGVLDHVSPDSYIVLSVVTGGQVNRQALGWRVSAAVRVLTDVNLFAPVL